MWNNSTWFHEECRMASFFFLHTFNRSANRSRLLADLMLLAPATTCLMIGILSSIMSICFLSSLISWMDWWRLVMATWSNAFSLFFLLLSPDYSSIVWSSTVGSVYLAKYLDSFIYNRVQHNPESDSNRLYKTRGINRFFLSPIV